MSEWKPIETAPREGDEILIARHVQYRERGDVWVMHVAWYDRRAAKWCTLHAPNLVDPTHWQPLPDPPTDEAQK